MKTRIRFVQIRTALQRYGAYSILAIDNVGRAWSYEYMKGLGWRWRLTTFENDPEFEFEPTMNEQNEGKL